MTKKSNLSSSDSFFQPQNAPKSVFGRGYAPDPAGGAYDAPPDPPANEKNIKASLLNLTLNMCYKNDKKIKFVIIRFVLSTSKCTKIRDPTGGAYDAPPDPLVGWGGGYPLPIPLPARRLWRLELRRLGSQAPST